jgi:hypothetical protein
MNSSSNQNQRGAGNPPTLTSGNEPLFLRAVDENGRFSHFFGCVPSISLTASFSNSSKANRSVQGKRSLTCALHEKMAKFSAKISSGIHPPARPITVPSSCLSI